MDKMEKIQNDRDLAHDMAKSFKCESYLQDSVPTLEDQALYLRSFFFDRLKRDVASKLSVIEAYYTASNNLEDVDDCLHIFGYLQEFYLSLSQFLLDYKLCAEEDSPEPDEE